MLRRSLVVSLLLPTVVFAQARPDSGLLAEINAIRAIDNHAHPSPASAAGAEDNEFEPPDSIPPLAPPARLREGNPEWLNAWRTLWTYSPAAGAVDRQRLLAMKNSVRREKGTAYHAWVLDRLGIETMLVNRFRMGAGLIAPRFRFVWTADPLIFPLNNEEGKRQNPDRRAGYAEVEQQLKRFISEEGLTDLPPTLDAYVARFLVPSLERRKARGAVAIKFVTAYLRPIDFGNPTREDAARVYSRYIGGGVAPAAEYKTLQDYLFRRLAVESGRVGLAVHIHVGMGPGPFFDNRGADPFLLSPVLLDPSLRGTTFVLIHGGLPFAAASRPLFAKPNVYVDFSSQAFLTSTRELSAVIRSWIEFRPEKVMFGTDAYPLTKVIGWEEVGWLASTSGRQALALALTGMMEDGEITRERASELARMVMRENAARLYGLK